ncbi:MAG TPA: hypothetical protein VFG69_09995, partial [Nannocystaceae bacterium]|nr:hypothetical protein [Nannocystaceae bacterium]
MSHARPLPVLFAISLACGADDEPRETADSMTGIGVTGDEPTAGDSGTGGLDDDGLADSTGGPMCDPECEGVCIAGECCATESACGEICCATGDVCS